jgi:hypothetical protein
MMRFLSQHQSALKLIKDGRLGKPVYISSKFNLSKESNFFNVNMSSLKSGEVKSQAIIFNLVNSAKESGNYAISVSSVGTGENTFPAVINEIPINEDVSSLIFLHACAYPSNNRKTYTNIADFFDSADLLGWYEIVYDDGFRTIVPIQYGVNILEWNPGGERRVDKSERKTPYAQNIYSSLADPVSCSANSKDNPITFFAYEWGNPRFGKIIKEINLHGEINYQVHVRPLKNNAIILKGISKVKKREISMPRKIR